MNKEEHEIVDYVKMFYTFSMNELNACDVDPVLDYLNYIVDRMEMNNEQILWLCFLYGVTYHLPSAIVIWNEFPDLYLADIPRLTSWWSKNAHKVPFQIDKQKCKPHFVNTVASYQQLVGNSQQKYFDTLLSSKDPQDNFDKMWTPLKSIFCFGRFSTWNWCQALKHVYGYNVEPTKLMLGEPDSISFTDGLAYAFGLTDKVTQKVVLNTGKRIKQYYKWTTEEKEEMESACSTMKSLLKIDNFQLETLACAFKKIWRNTNSRYIGYYNDRLADDINNTAPLWVGVDWNLLWDAREECVPKKYIRDNLGVDRNKYKLTPEEKINL